MNSKYKLLILYHSGNALREFIKKCLFKNIAYKINVDIKKIEEIIKTDTSKVECPSFKLYTILNYPNKVLDKAFKHNLQLSTLLSIGTFLPSIFSTFFFAFIMVL